jgi:hypothetical protein
MSSSQLPLRLATEPVVFRTLEQIAREGARRALQKAIEEEVAEYVQAHKHHVDESNHRLVVRNGRKPPRTILSGVGPLEVIQPRVDDRRVDENGVRFRFALVLDRQADVLWWYRNKGGAGNFMLQGYKKNKIYPDFVVRQKDTGPHHVLVLESKGKHLEGNPDTTYKRAVAAYFGAPARWSRGSNSASRSRTMFFGFRCSTRPNPMVATGKTSYSIFCRPAPN